MQQFAYYSYYRVAPGDETRAEAAVHLAQADVATRTGVRTSLLKKRGEPDLWMEVYESVSDTERFERALAEAIEAHQLASFLHRNTVRTTECFIADRCA